MYRITKSHTSYTFGKIKHDTMRWTYRFSRKKT